MAAKCEKTLGADTRLIEGAGGIFDVHVDGSLVFSKHQVGDFPDEEVLIAEIQAN